MSNRREQDLWAAVPVDLRQRAVEHLRQTLEPSLLEHARELHAEDPGDWIVPYHFSTGMFVRNTLRDVVADAELPPAEQPDGSLEANWDDYYVAALEQAAAVQGTTS